MASIPFHNNVNDLVNCEEQKCRLNGMQWLWWLIYFSMKWKWKRRFRHQNKSKELSANNNSFHFSYSTDLCSSEHLPEVEIFSLLEEQIPKYRLRADTLTQFTGYQNEVSFSFSNPGRSPAKLDHLKNRINILFQFFPIYLPGLVCSQSSVTNTTKRTRFEQRSNSWDLELFS